jgi:hypothetical protein
VHTSSKAGDSGSDVRNWQRARFVLGLAQMFGVAFSLALLISTGVNRYSLCATVVTCLATSVSVLLFGRRS